MSAPSVQHIFERVAERFGLTAAQMRGRGPARPYEARLAFCYLAKGMADAGDLVVAMKIARDISWVAHAREEAASRCSYDHDFARIVREIEIEVLSEVGVAERTDFPLPLDVDPGAIAERLTAGRRAAMGVGIAHLEQLGSAYLAMEAELTTRRAAASPDEAPIVAAARAVQRAYLTLQSAEFGNTELAARNALMHALKVLSKTLGEANVETHQNPRREPARAAN